MQSIISYTSFSLADQIASIKEKEYSDIGSSLRLPYSDIYYDRV